MDIIDSNISEDDYAEKIDEIADGVEEQREWSAEHDEPFDLYDTTIREVENSGLITRTHAALAALQHSVNSPEEWKHLVDESTSWHDVVQAMAYDVVKQDTFEELHRRKDDPEAADYHAAT